LRKSIIISLSLIVTVTAAALVYLLLWEPLVRDRNEAGKRSGLLVVRAYARRSEAVLTLPAGVGVGLHVDLRAISAEDWRSKGPRRDRGGTTVGRNLALAVERGFNTLVVRLVDGRRGGAFFEDPHIHEAGPVTVPAGACFIAAEARRHKLVSLADVSGLFPRREAAPMVADLLEGCDFDGIVAPDLPRSQIESLHEMTLGAGKLLVHSSAEAAADGDIVLGADLPDEREFPSLLFAHARALQRPRWLSLHAGILETGGSRAGGNSALFRSLQVQPDGYLWTANSVKQIRWTLERARITQQVSRFARWRDARTRRQPKLANLVLALPGAEQARGAREAFVQGVMPAVVNGVALSGFDLHATYGEVLPGAAAYIVLAIGRTPDASVRMPPFIEVLLAQERPVVLIMDGLTADGGWRSALSRIGFRGRNWRAVDDPVPTVRYGEALLTWHGGLCDRLDCRTALLNPKTLTGEVLVASDLDQGPSALVARLGNKALINANVLTLQSAYVVNQLLQPALEAPFEGAAVVGERSAFFTRSGSRLRVALPVPDASEIRLVRYGVDGERQPVEVVSYQAPLSTTLLAGELLIVEPTEH
jgi:hypothetical protein